MNVQRAASAPAGTDTFLSLYKREDGVLECATEALKLSISDGSKANFTATTGSPDWVDGFSSFSNTPFEEVEAIEIRFKTPDGSQEFVVSPNGELSRAGKPDEVLAELRELEEYPPVLQAAANVNNLIFLTKGCISVIPYDTTGLKEEYIVNLPLGYEHPVDFVCEGSKLRMTSVNREGVLQITDVNFDDDKGVRFEKTIPLGEKAIAIPGFTLTEAGKFQATEQ